MASFTVQSPATVAANRSGPHAIVLVGSGTTWSGSTTFTLSGLAGIALVQAIVNGPTSAVLIVTTGPATGTLTISDGTHTATVPVKLKPTYTRRWFPDLDKPR